MTRALWVVEARNGSRWEPTEAVGLTRDVARSLAIDEVCEERASQTRVVRYIPAPKDGETFA